jgi:hypothetical protein
MQNCDNVMNEVGRKYAVGPILGKGTFGVVFLGRDLLRGRDVVIKRVPVFCHLCRSFVLANKMNSN